MAIDTMYYTHLHKPLQKLEILVDKLIRKQAQKKHLTILRVIKWKPRDWYRAKDLWQNSRTLECPYQFPKARTPVLQAREKIYFR